MEEHLIQPEPPDPLLEDTRAFWRDIGKDLVKESIGTIDETAKQLIGVAGILEGLYFHAITYGDLRGKLPPGGQWLYSLPVLLLLLSLIAALLVFLPDRSKLNFNSPEASKLIYERTVAGKLLALRAASLFLVLGILATLVAVVNYLNG